MPEAQGPPYHKILLENETKLFPDIFTCKCGVVRVILLFENVGKAQVFGQQARLPSIGRY